MEILKMTFSASVLILAIVVIRALALHKLPKKTFIVLWGVALCRLFIPFSIPSRFSIYTVLNMLKSTFVKTSSPITLPNVMAVPDIWTAPDMANPALTDTATFTTSSVVIVWLIGMAACALFFLVTHLRCRRNYKTALPIDNEFVRRWLHENPTRRNVQIRQSDKIAAPLTYGIFSPVVLMPKTTDWTDETRLQYILSHEYVHIRRFDILTKLLLVSAVCIHWFNPFVWVMYVLFNRDIELSCDETVVRTFGEMMKSAYALTLIGLEEKKSRGLTPLVNNFSKNAIEERIVSIMQMKKTSLVGIILALVLVIGATTVFATTRGAAASESRGETGESSKTSISYEDVADYLEYDEQNDIYRFEGRWVRLVFDDTLDGSTSSYGMEPSPYDNWGNGSICLKTVRNDKTHEIEGLIEMTQQEADDILNGSR